MDHTESHNSEFDRTKIFEKLHCAPEPLGYNSKISWVVQQQIAATNGIHYIDRIGKIKEYPAYHLPVSKVNSGIMLDIGTGWGRWLVAGANRGYIPVGIDIRLEFCETALNTLKAHNKNGYAVVADLKELPFKNDIFDMVWSFSVIQHTHEERMLNCLKHIFRILRGGGFTKLEFPNRNGIRNYFNHKKKAVTNIDDYNSWEVRYYSIHEYKARFLQIFKNFSFKVHSALGIGVLPEDLKYVSYKNKFLCLISLAGTNIMKVIAPLKKFADSIYIKSTKNGGEADSDSLARFLRAHADDPGNNLNIIHLLQCPISHSPLRIAEGGDFLLSMDGNIKYPVINNIPLLIGSAAIQNEM